jgi:hypothetical protein
VEEPDENSSNIGDKKVQEILVGIVRLQADQAKVTEFVDERAKLLSDIAEQAKEEYDKIAEEAMRTMDEARSKVKLKLRSSLPFSYMYILISPNITLGYGIYFEGNYSFCRNPCT